MAKSNADGQPSVVSSEPKTDPDSESDDEEIIETSPCSRWEKHKKELSQRNVPGIDCSFLAMDTEDGVEVVWNEMMFSERKSWKSKEVIFKRVFENLTQLDHPNIVKFHKYWVDQKDEIPRLIFIEEYMTSGSLKLFLKKTKTNKKTLNIKAWKRWCKQVLSALSYLHDCAPPIVHGNLNCDTIFIQHNGLMKIGTELKWSHPLLDMLEMAPDTIHNHVKTCKHERRNMHFIAPEYDGESLFSALSSDLGKDPSGRQVNRAADVYSFGIVALEMATLQWTEAPLNITLDSISAIIDQIEDDMQKNFMQQCLKTDPLERPSVRELLLHPVLLEVYSLKILAGHAVADMDADVKHVENRDDHEPDYIMAEIKHANKDDVQWKYSKVQPLEFEKFLEEIKTGLYPLTGMETSKPKKETVFAQLNATHPKSPSEEESCNSTEEEQYPPEDRLVTQTTVTVDTPSSSSDKSLTLVVRLDDKMNRTLSCKVKEGEKGLALAQELVFYGLINEVDKEKVANALDEKLTP